MENVTRYPERSDGEAAADLAHEAIDTARAKGNEYWSAAKAKSKDLWSSSKSMRDKAWNSTRGFIQKNPGQAIGYAVLLGAVIAVLLLPRKED